MCRHSQQVSHITQCGHCGIAQSNILLLLFIQYYVFLSQNGFIPRLFSNFDLFSLRFLNASRNTAPKSDISFPPMKRVHTKTYKTMLTHNPVEFFHLIGQKVLIHFSSVAQLLQLSFICQHITYGLVCRMLLK